MTDQNTPSSTLSNLAAAPKLVSPTEALGLLTNVAIAAACGYLIGRGWDSNSAGIFVGALASLLLPIALGLAARVKFYLKPAPAQATLDIHVVGDNVTDSTAEQASAVIETAKKIVVLLVVLTVLGCASDKRQVLMDANQAYIAVAGTVANEADSIKKEDRPAIRAALQAGSETLHLANTAATQPDRNFDFYINTFKTLLHQTNLLLQEATNGPDLGSNRSR